LYVPAIDVPLWPTTKDPEPDTTRTVDAAVREMIAGKFDASVIASEVLQDWTTRGADIADSMKSYGGYKRLEFVERIDQGSTTDYVYRAAFDKSIILVATMTKDRKVADVETFEPPTG
jgi:hypothetical protein